MRSVINKLKKSGPSIEPCGTRAITTSDEIVLLLMITFCFLFSNNYIINSKHLLKNHRLLVLLKEGSGL